MNTQENCKKILVTGANGYIGSHVVKSLLNKGAHVIAADIRNENIDQRAEIHLKDIFSDDKDIFSELGSPDVCLHMAWRNGFVHNDFSHLQDFSAHCAFLRRMVEGGVGHVAIIGTMHEIGFYEGEVDETTPTNPTSLYGIAKNALRQAMETYLRGKVDVFQWLRCFYVMGDDAKNHSVFSKLLEAERAGQNKFPFTSGRNKYDFISIAELADQIAATVLQSDVQGIVNCCSGYPVSLGDRAEQFIKEEGLHIELDYGAFPDRPYDSKEIWGNAHKIRQILQAANNGEDGT